MKMRISDVKATLLKLVSLKRQSGKINATLPTNPVSGINEAQIENQLEYLPTNEITRRYWSLPANDTTKQYWMVKLQVRARTATLSPRHEKLRSQLDNAEQRR